MCTLVVVENSLHVLILVSLWDKQPVQFQPVWENPEDGKMEQ